METGGSGACTRRLGGYCTARGGVVGKCGTVFAPYIDLACSGSAWGAQAATAAGSRASDPPGAGC